MPSWSASLYGDEASQPGLELGRIDDLAEELGRAIAEPLHQRLELAFSSSDEDVAELAEVLGAAYREWKTQRIEAAARDQVGRRVFERCLPRLSPKGRSFIGSLTPPKARAPTVRTTNSPALSPRVRLGLRASSTRPPIRGAGALWRRTS